METLRIYSPAIVLVLWSLAVTLGCNGALCQLAGVIGTSIAAGMAIEELAARYREQYRQGRHDHRFFT